MPGSRKVLVAGTGVSGMAAAGMILRSGGEVLLFDSDASGDAASVLTKFAPDDHISLILGELTQNDLSGVHLAVLSPGIPLSAPFIRVLDLMKVPIIGELELAYQASRGALAAITGTNGKTTTTALTGKILEKHFRDVHVVGNIGRPFSAEALDTSEESAAVVEVSSFMLETISRFKPHVSAILNITPDHLDRHLTMDSYIRAKETITMNQDESDTVVLNFMDPVLREFGRGPELKPRVLWFSSGEVPEGDALYLRDGDIIIRENGLETHLVATSELRILGVHNHENAMAAAAVGLRMGVETDGVREALRSFEAVEHRIEFVRERCGVRYFNDSKGTNPDAAIKALDAMPGPTVLIAGGYDKKSEYDEWTKLFPGKVKKLILLGETRDRINESCKRCGFTEVTYVEDMNEAVRTAASYADEGDYVLLSPACASWDMYKNFEERGRIFKDCVNRL